MTQVKTEKTFDCVAFQRKARSQMSKEYNKDKDAYFRKLHNNHAEFMNHRNKKAAISGT